MNAEIAHATHADSVQILPAGPRDTFALYRLEKRCFPLDSWPFMDIVLAVLLPSLHRLKAVVDGKLVGFIMGEREKGSGWVATFGVDPDYRGQGIGTSLLTSLEELLDMPSVKLCVRKSNVTAIGLYERHGYVVVDTWPRYYKGGEDALVMQKWSALR